MLVQFLDQSYTSPLWSPEPGISKMSDLTQIPKNSIVKSDILKIGRWFYFFIRRKSLLTSKVHLARVWEKSLGQFFLLFFEFAWKMSDKTTTSEFSIVKSDMRERGWMIFFREKDKPKTKNCANFSAAGNRFDFS